MPAALTDPKPGSLLKRDDPRQLRRLQVGVPDDWFSFFVRPVVTAIFILVLPIVYLRRLLRGRWSLMTFMAMPAVVGLAVLTARWPVNYNPTNFGIVGWNVSQAFTGCFAWLTVFVTVWMGLRAAANQKWRTVAWMGMGVALATIASAALILVASGFFQETDPVRYTLDGRWMCVFGGVQMFGTLFCIGMIFRYVSRRLKSWFTHPTGAV